jgi:hypothetical protein
MAAVAASALWLSYSGAYMWARATHLLVRESPMCDRDRIVPGAGAKPSVKVVFAPRVAVEDAYWLFRGAWPSR